MLRPLFVFLLSFVIAWIILLHHKLISASKTFFFPLEVKTNKKRILKTAIYGYGWTLHALSISAQENWWIAFRKPQVDAVPSMCVVRLVCCVTISKELWVEIASLLVPILFIYDYFEALSIWIPHRALSLLPQDISKYGVTAPDSFIWLTLLKFFRKLQSLELCWSSEFFFLPFLVVQSNN